MNSTSNLEIIDRSGILLVDSRLIALDLGITHKAFLSSVRKHLAAIESSFQRVIFETAPFETEGGVQDMTFCLLTEDQATFIATMSRNTPQVIAFKAHLVKAFSAAKKLTQSAPMSMFDFAEYSIAELRKQDAKLNAIASEQSELSEQIVLLKEQNELLRIQAQVQEYETLANTAEIGRFSGGHGDYFTVAGWCNLKGYSRSSQQLGILGRTASAMCRIRNLPIQETRDARWGNVGAYPESVLMELDFGSSV